MAVVNEEELSVVVQKYLVLYDKSNKEFHRKDVKKNAWKAVAEELGLEDSLFLLLRLLLLRTTNNNVSIYCLFFAAILLISQNK